VQKALEENDPKKKDTNQMTDETRENPVLKDHERTVNKSLKDAQTVTQSEERKDFTEVSPAAMSEFICENCGKSFQNQHDLVRHKRYEEGKEEGRKTNKESRTNTQTGVIASSPTGGLYTGDYSE
jgi:hypothetical protein